MPSDRSRQVIPQNIADPGDKRSWLRASERPQITLGFQEGNLNKIRRIDSPAQSVVEITMSQHPEIAAILFQQISKGVGIAGPSEVEKLLGRGVWQSFKRASRCNWFGR